MTRRLLAISALAALTLGGECLFSPSVAHAQKGKGGGAGVSADKAEPEAQEIAISVGENKTIPAIGVKNYTEPAGGIVDVKLTTDNKQFVITGIKPGSTSLLLIKDNGKEVNWIINVFNRSPAVVENELKQLLEGYPSVRVQRVGARFFLEGSVSSEADVHRMQQIASLYQGQVESLVGVGGTVDRTNIRIDFYFIQYDKSKGYQFGISYPSVIGGPSIQSTFGYDFVAKQTTAVASVVNQPLPGLDIAANYGWAKFVKQATVITTNGMDASFQNGGEQNFPLASGLTSTIQKIAFGITITVQPLFDPSTRELQVKVVADIADLVPPVSGTILPGRQTSNLSTIVHMKLGQSLVLSGIHTANERHQVNGIPLLSTIPILGVFFGTHGDQQEETEGMIFIVPSVVEPSDASATALIDETLRKFDDWDGGKVPTTYDKKGSKYEPPASSKK